MLYYKSNLSFFKNYSTKVYLLSVSYLFDTNVYLFTYMFIYNISLTLMFWSFFTVVLSKFKNLYSFSNFSFNYNLVLIFTVLLCSMSGVPPFIGFFSKLFILTLISNSSFFIFYTLFFVVLFFGLYFYIQNIRFIHSTNLSNSDTPFLGNERSVLYFHYFSIALLFFIILGIFYLDDVLVFFTWILS